MFTTPTKRNLSQCVRVAALAMLFGAALTATADAKVFVSAQSGAWTNSSTWTAIPPGGTPGANDDVVIWNDHVVGLVPASSSSQPSVSCRTLTIGPDAALAAQYPTGDKGRNMSIRTTLSVDPYVFDPNNPYVNPTSYFDPGNPGGFAPGVSLLNFGTIQGQDSAELGGSILLSTDWSGGPLAGWFQNQGVIRGGDGDLMGGNVLVFYAAGVAANLGEIRGGGNNVTASISAGYAVMYGGVYAGNYYVTGDLRGRVRGGGTPGGSGGAALVIGTMGVPDAPEPIQALNAFAAEIEGGQGSVLDDGSHRGGGDAGLLALGSMIGSSATNWDFAEIQGGMGCPGGDAELFGNFTHNRGDVRAGRTSCQSTARVDPPEGLIEGGARIWGTRVELAADGYLIIALDEWTGPADPNDPNDPNDPGAPIYATGDMEIKLGAGGSLDLSNLTATGNVYVEAHGKLTIHADVIELPDPNDPNGPAIFLPVDPNDPTLPPEVGDYIDGNPVEWLPVDPNQPEDAYHHMFVGPYAEYSADPGETLELFIPIANLGNRTESVHYDLATDPNFPDWTTGPVSQDLVLTPMDGLVERVLVDVPAGAMTNDETKVTVLALDSTSDAYAEIFVRVRETSACIGDIDHDGDTDLADLAQMLASYNTCSGEPGYNPDADLNDSGCVDLPDLAILLSDYGCGT